MENISLNLIQHYWPIAVVIVFLAAILVGFPLRFVLPAMQLRAELKRATSALRRIQEKAGGAVVDLDGIEREAMSSPSLSRPWREFAQTLRPERREDENGRLQITKWRAPALAEMFFSEQALVDVRLKTDFYKHLPGILTGLGIIGTFSGLIIGLTDLDVSLKPDEAQKQLKNLVELVGHAFIVSATFDAKLDSLLEWKRGLSADMLNGSGDLSPADFGDLEEPGGASAFGNQELSRGDLAALDPDAFEAFCAALWSKLGYPRVYKTPRVGDQGVDVVALKEGNGVLIQCKSSAHEERELGWEAVKDVVAGSSSYAARHPGVRFALIAATNAKFNRTARAQANINHVELLDIDDLSRLLSEHKLRRGEMDRFLFAGWEAERAAGRPE